jgi:hypothetical protein
MCDGLVRAVSEIFFGTQNDTTILQAIAWLQRRREFTTGLVLETLAERVHPRTLIEWSPSIVFSLSSMKRASSMFPQAKFIHILQHPRGYCEAVVRAISKAAADAEAIPSWMLNLLSYPEHAGELDHSENPRGDPQGAWYGLHQNICKFLESISSDRKIAIRSEDIFIRPETVLREIAEWIGIGADHYSIEEMQHPERSPFACFGPPGARYGSDPSFLGNPTLLPPTSAIPPTIPGRLAWRDDGVEFSAGVRALAHKFGYT